MKAYLINHKNILMKKKLKVKNKLLEFQMMLKMKIMIEY